MEMKELIDRLNAASKAYYQQDEEIMTNFEYDALYDQLVEMEQKTGVVLSNSPTRKIGYEVVGALQKVPHATKILSLDKTKEIEKLESFLGEYEGILSWKLDGLTIVLHYENGGLVQALTRGNGEVGEDVTHNVNVFSNVPVKIQYDEPVSFRGEALISYEEFQRINESLPDDEKYKNPRNLCSGTVRQLDNQVVAGRNVSFIAFGLIAGGPVFELHSQEYEWMAQMGFQVVEHTIVNQDTVGAAVKEMEAAISRNPYASDGLVLIYNDIAYGESLGQTTKFPRDSIAFKWQDEEAETVLTDVLWNTSRTGLINPVATFEPVELEGTTVKQASLHNLSIIEDLSLGIGDRIKVYKANMIIPQVSENLTRKGGLSIPENCPVCGFETEVVKVNDAANLYCTNPNCEAKQVLGLTHFVSRDAMNIEGFSEETIRKLVAREYLHFYPDIFRLSQYKEEIKAMEGFGERSCEKLLQSIEKAKTAALPNFIYALGINHVGLANAKLLCQYYQHDLDKIRRAAEEELVDIEGFGSVIAHSIHQYFANEKNIELLDDCLQFVQFLQYETGNQDLQDMVFVITGSLQHFENRKALQQAIEAKGGKVTGSVSSKTNFLINNDKESASSKNKKALELDIPILSEEDFMKRFIHE